jgi:hypothetical protein
MLFNAFFPQISYLLVSLLVGHIIGFLLGHLGGYLVGHVIGLLAVGYLIDGIFCWPSCWFTWTQNTT